MKKFYDILALCVIKDKKVGVNCFYVGQLFGERRTKAEDVAYTRRQASFVVIGEYFDVLKATSEEESWFIVLKNEGISETDVHMILNESKKLKEKPQRCILISMGGLDENTRVKALQEKMWIWNEGEINTLLNIYDKSYIL